MDKTFFEEFVDAERMAAERFLADLAAYKKRMAGGCEEVTEEEESTIGARLTEKEFSAAKKSLLEILGDADNSPSLRLKAAEHLAALSAAYEQSQWAV